MTEKFAKVETKHVEMNEIMFDDFHPRLNVIEK
jgi:hypothetical protein